MFCSDAIINVVNKIIQSDKSIFLFYGYEEITDVLRERLLNQLEGEIFIERRNIRYSGV